MHLDWCAASFFMIGPFKSKSMIFGPIPNVLPTLVIGAKHFEFVNEFKYVRVMFVIMA